MASHTTFSQRELQKGDFRKGYLDLLAQLTVVGNTSEQQFTEQFELIQAKQPDYHVLVLEDNKEHTIAASATLLIEYKFIRQCGKAGHIEDVVVDSAYRGQRLGQRLIKALVEQAERQGCYKIILDCASGNMAFYEKCGFSKKEEQMVKYLHPEL